MLNRFIVIVFSFIFLGSCTEKSNDEKHESNTETVQLSAIQIIDSVYKTHGSEKLKTMNVAFDFRKHSYSLKKTKDGTVMSRITVDTSKRTIKDVWSGSSLIRTIDTEEVIIDSLKESAYMNSINSVFYFAFLPKALKDPAVNLELLDEITIKDKDYYKIKVTFSEEGGGEDHHDIFVYWFDKGDFSMDYLAYEYFTEGGGIRFREAINTSEVEGIVFQDYINYKPKMDDIKLENTDQMFENGNLKEVSRIKLENVKVD